MAEGPGFTVFLAVEQSSHPAPLTARQVSNIQEAGPGPQPGKEALGLSSEGSVTNVVLAWATPRSFVCLLESDLWFVPNRNGL